jgi:hypothetical protein
MSQYMKENADSDKEVEKALTVHLGYSSFINAIMDDLFQCKILNDLKEGRYSTQG